MPAPASFVGEAPGRLDVLGGVADYSGALVIQTPTRALTRVTIDRLGDPVLECVPEAGAACRIPLAAVTRAISCAGENNWGGCRAALDHCSAPRWSRYVAGCVITLACEFGWTPDSGLKVSIFSEVPQSMGVSSSAALEVATLRALASLAGVEFTGRQLAHLGQRAENLVVGAPCGLMDQLASAFGEPGRLLPILCRPDELAASVPLPSGVVTVGWPSGVRHSVGDSPYATARAAAFMGKRRLEHILGRKFAHLSEVAPTTFAGLHAELPERWRGADFLSQFGGTDDPLTTVDPGRDYPVAASTRFAIEEHARSARLVELLLAAEGRARTPRLSEAGALLAASHRGYGAMGLGAEATDAIVEGLLALGPAKGVYGARISGGGSGGTVVALVEVEALPALLALGRSRWGSGPCLIF